MAPIEYIRRERLKLTQAQFARLCGVAQATVSRWERGELHPGIDDVARIIAATPDARLTPADFFEAAA